MWFEYTALRQNKVLSEVTQTVGREQRDGIYCWSSANHSGSFLVSSSAWVDISCKYTPIDFKIVAASFPVNCDSSK